LWWVEHIKWRWKIALGVSLLWIIAIVGALQFPALHTKMETTAGLFSGDYEKANTATSLRLPIWKVAVRIAEDHWLNGIGPRGFRYIYPAYVPKDDFWMTIQHLDKKTGERLTTRYGPHHPHQLFLEVLVETGIIGVLCFLFALGYWIRLWWKTARTANMDALPWMAAVLVAIMPINAHMAFYASFWSCITWWLIAVSLAYWQAERIKQ